MTRMDVVITALYLLKGDSRVVDTEDVASKCHELEPTAFRWRTRADQINLELVRVVLSDAKKKAFGWVEGSGRTGWSLTASGREYAVGLGSVAQAASRERQTRGRPGVGRDISESRRATEKGRIYSTEAWKRWAKGERSATSRHAQEVFRIDTYSTGRIRSMKINRLQALFAGQLDMQEFLAAMARCLDA